MIWLLIGYMFLFIHRPFEIWPILGDVHLERIYMLAMILYWIVYPKKTWLPNVQHLAYLGFAAAVLLCWGMSSYAATGQIVVENYFKILAFYLLLVTTVHDEKSLRTILMGFLGVMAIYMLHSFREFLGGRHTYRMGISRMIGVDSSMGDPNTFGASIVFALPFVTLFWTTSKSRTLKWILAGYVALSVGCILLTGSRSSLLGLFVWGLFAVGRSKSTIRWGLLALVLAPVLFFVLPASLQTRFETIIDPDVGPKNAQESGEGRLEGFYDGLALWEESPLTGCGPGAWKPATHKKVESHNLYGQLVGEMGTAGFLTFGCLLACYWMNLRRLKQYGKRLPEKGRSDFLTQAGRAIGLSVMLMLFLGCFGHNLFRFNWVWYGGFLIATCWCLDQRLRTQRYQSFPAYLPPLRANRRIAYA